MSKRDKDRALLSAFRRAAQAVKSMTEERAAYEVDSHVLGYYGTRRQTMNGRAYALALLTAWGL